jgi:hypothetical protein
LRVAEVHLDVGRDGEAGVFGHLHPAVPGERGAQLLGQPADVLGDRVTVRVSFPSTAISIRKREWRSTSVAT